MGDFGELVLVLGDVHVAQRKDQIPEQFRELLVPGKMQHVLCSGNITSKAVEEYLRSLANSVHTVRGDADYVTGLNELPESKVVRIGEFTVGLVHGHTAIPWGDVEALSNVQRQLDCDVLVCGHTHKNDVYEYQGKFFVNPGSITGAYTPLQPSVTPSFVLMAIKGKKLITYVYELRDGEVNVSKSEFTKSS